MYCVRIEFHISGPSVTAQTQSSGLKLKLVRTHLIFFSVCKDVDLERKFSQVLGKAKETDKTPVDEKRVEEGGDDKKRKKGTSVGQCHANLTYHYDMLTYFFHRAQAVGNVKQLRLKVKDELSMVLAPPQQPQKWVKRRPKWLRMLRLV